MEMKSNYVDIFKREIFPAKVRVEKGKIASIERIDTPCDTYILPGFVDAHIHIESSMLPPSEFARLAVCHGTVATVSDPHEIANVLGIPGVGYMLDNSEMTPFKFYFGASPCVPATTFETSGATLGPDEIESLLKMPQIKYLSEVMNFPGVINGDPDMLAKIAKAKALHKRIDGHAPGLRGDELTKYIEAGIETDHEAFTYEEGLEKLQKGMKILIREGSAAKNFEALAPLIPAYPNKLMFCSDDRHPNDLAREHIDGHVRRAIAKGYDLFDVLRIASVNPVEHYGLEVGLLRVGDPADFIVVEDLKDFKVLQTVIDGEIVARGKKPLIDSVTVETPNHFHTGIKKEEDFILERCVHTEIIHALDHSLITEEEIMDLSSGKAKDVLKITVVNRYEDVKPAVAYVHGFGLKKGAIASSVAHDSHNIIAVGCSDALIAKAVNTIIGNRGGICAVTEEEIEVLSLPIAGLMSDKDGFEVANRYADLDRMVREYFTSLLSAPFMTLSFMALLVIPELKLSDKGLFDGRSFHFIDSCRR
ncbi:adenine deaminase [Sulfurovum sp. NBC37-1]|uniref:Adenine deaminase n=1 Tax=Sulfurovum sp. (strain NBC37-1) TaxID=387093 RepID=ADEC_SULNB|nr:adenine deaminase [Sulfurovum sp. NBC37-1]A6Q8K5.1 RecName: Full=Adenine deaminase; Short=Adenase; Short=Adenine aminase [Sulfurovum sp. NBC37-1]BAF71814.1 adenine deaminase [Sulfurovum sp. NBC37-1]